MKITEAQLRQIIREEANRLHESRSIRGAAVERSLKQIMRQIRNQIGFIEGQLMVGRYDFEDMYDKDFGHIAQLNAMIDVAREKAAEEGVPFVEPDLSRIDYYRPF